MIPALKSEWIGTERHDKKNDYDSDRKAYDPSKDNIAVFWA